MGDLVATLSAHLPVMCRYLVSAALYCAYNNLSYVSLAVFDPTTYFMFLQVRLLLTGVVYQCLFDRRLTRTQWGSLLLVTVGCMVQKMELPQETHKPTASPDSSSPNGNLAEGVVVEEEEEESKLLTVGFGLVFILIQVCCSVFAGVYNEKLLKTHGDLHIMAQNAFMYVDSIACNAALLAAFGELSTAFNAEALQSINVRG